jgi:hypothetical protein
MPDAPKRPARPEPPKNLATSEDPLRDAGPEVLSDDEKKRLGEEASRSEDA